MSSFFAFVHHGIKAASNNPLNDGETLAQRCVNQLKALDDEQFPPCLLILLASPAYLDTLKSEQLLHGVLQKFEQSGYPNVELMGCSVAAVFFNRCIHREGALLICLASRLLEAKVSASDDASNDPEKAITSLLHKLNLLTERGDEIHSFANRTLFALFPGFSGNKYLAPELHESLRSQLRGRISIFGGVATASDPRSTRPGLLFANRKIYRKPIVVAASVECGTPFGISLSQGLTDTGHSFNVAEVDPQNPRLVRRFSEGAVGDVMEQLRQLSPLPLFDDEAMSRDPAVDMPTLEGETLRLSREVRQGEPLHLLIPEPGKMRQNFMDGIKESLRRAWLLNPIAGLGFRSSGLLRHSKEFGLNLENENAFIERDLSRWHSLDGKPFVGGFVDGEAGVDANGKSVLGNWGNATLVFGDELRFRTPVYRGFEKLADFAGKRVAETHKDAIDRLTKLVYDIGFPGALLSLCMYDQERGAIIAQSASGSHYKNILNEVPHYPLDGDDVLAIVARENQPLLIIDSRHEKCGSMKAASKEGIISQYIMPFTGISGEVNAVLQIDLGDISYDSQLYPTEETVLASLGKIVNSGLNRTFNWEESKIIRKLDQAMSACLPAETISQGLQQYLEYALKAFKLRRGHIRIAQEDKHRLKLVAGIGDYYEETRKDRPQIDFAEVSPTAQAFRDEKLIIINDPENNQAHQDMCRQLEHEGASYQRLRDVGSYANVPFKSERGERGTINLVSSEAWFFMWFHERALKALGERIGFLLETLRRKEREAFLFGASPQFAQIQDLNSVGTLLGKEIARFANTVNAEVASLYLWDEDRKRYILRAQHGWNKPEWVNAAYYTKREFWTGTTAIAGRPRHIPDLFKYYKRYRTSVTRYTKEAFGQELSEDFTVEAIGLQLRIADDRLGVLTFYRSIKPHDESSFLTTDTELLQQGADNFASLISILQAYRREKWRSQEHVRRQEVYDAIVPSEETKEDFETRVCDQVLKSYRAVKASFYKVETVGETPQLKHRNTFVRDPLTNRITNVDMSAREIGLVEKAAHVYRRKEKELVTARVILKDEEAFKPERVALAEMVERACIPLVSEKRLVGILDLHWSLDHRRSDSSDYQHGEGFLRMLGEVVGSAYGRTQTKKQAETMRAEAESKLYQGQAKLLQSEDRTRYVIQATSAYVLQHHHELRTIVQHMSSLLESLRALRKESAGKEKGLIEELSNKIKAGDATLKRMIEIGRKMAAPAYERLRLKNLILAALEKSHGNYADYDVEVGTTVVSESDSLWVDPSLIEIAFTNLMDNAFKSMKGRDRRTLNIKAEVIAGEREVTITIADTGIGMTEDKIQLILKEFYSVDDRISVGVMIARMILGLHGGRLSYDSVEGEGTKTLIALPLDYLEESL